MKANLINKLEEKLSAIAKAELTVTFGVDGIATLLWDGESRKPFENLQNVLGSRAYDFDTDNEDGFFYSGCLVNLN